MADPDPPEWPEECPACGKPTEAHPRTCSWWCPACEMDDDGLRDLEDDRRLEAYIEDRKLSR